MKRVIVSAVIFLALIFLVAGILYDNSLYDPKSVTSSTPPSREGKRHTFVLDEAFLKLAQPVAGTSKAKLKVGFIFIGKSGDYGFTYSHNQGRLALIERLGVETVVIDDVAEDENCLEAFHTLIAAGCRVIFSCSYLYMEYALRMADEHPDIYFLNCSGTGSRANLSSFFGRMYLIRYLTGIVAGLRTGTGKIGYVAAFPIPEVIRGLDAFALGVKRVNPAATVRLAWSYAWYDPGKERQLALTLIDQGCDVIAQHQDSVAPQVAAEERGVWSIGYHSSMKFFAPNAYLTGAVWNWAPFMIKQVQMVRDGAWTPASYWGGIEDGVVRLEPLTANVASGTREEVDRALAAFKEGFDVFEGPLYDNTGTLRVPEGEVLTDSEKQSMMWLADNIIGSGE